MRDAPIRAEDLKPAPTTSLAMTQRNSSDCHGELDPYRPGRHHLTEPASPADLAGHEVIGQPPSRLGFSSMSYQWEASQAEADHVEQRPRPERPP